ncbi:MAG: glycerol-3-phosphate 1-O-acyltransferase PlsY [Rikenellaceae bacterium]
MVITYYVIALLLLVAYLLGSIPSAVMVGKRYYGIDIREHGSRNAGSTNVLRVLGKRAALPVFLLDFMKGFVAVSLIGIVKYDAAITEEWIINIRIVAVFAAVAGHILPIFAGFKGGKGVATLVGAITGIYPPIMLYCFAVWFVVLFFSHYVSLSSMVAGVCLPIFTVLSPTANQSVPFIVFACVVAVLLIYTHRANITRLREGTESKIFVFRAQRLRDEAKRRAEAETEAETDKESIK